MYFASLRQKFGIWKLSRIRGSRDSKCKVSTISTHNSTEDNRESKSWKKKTSGLKNLRKWFNETMKSHAMMTKPTFKNGTGMRKCINSDQKGLPKLRSSQMGV